MRTLSIVGAFARALTLAVLCSSPVALTLSALPAAAQSPAQRPAALETLKIVTASGEHAFAIEVMRTDAERQRGLMFRRFLAPDRGMLFDFKVEQPVMMWMKNTYLPLDMVFISRSGQVVNVAENTEPLSERIIASGAPTYAVLELNAGIARSIGLKPGDKVVHAMFEK